MLLEHPLSNLGKIHTLVAQTFLNSFYKNITPSFVRAVNRTPTGRPSRADWRAMCSLPFPDAIESATSRPWNLSFRSLENSFLSWTRFRSGLNSMKSKGSPGTVNSFAKAGPTTITFSHSPFLIRPETWPHVPLPVESSAISSIALIYSRSYLRIYVIVLHKKPRSLRLTCLLVEFLAVEKLIKENIDWLLLQK